MRRAAIYTRQSLDRAGEGLAVARQLKACKQKAAERGWTVVDVYSDNDVSASSGKPRPEYARMLADLEAGRIDAVVVWDLDRLHRRPIELEAFLDLADRRRVALASVGGDVDLATDNGRMYARIKGVVARAEVERKSARQRAANEQRAEAGKPHVGRRPFGYSADGLEVVPSEAAEIRRAAATMLAGGTIRGIVADWAERGVLTSTGGTWRATELRRLLRSPRYIARRVHRGEDVGPGAWPPILDVDDWRALQAVLSDPRRHRAAPPSRYLLSTLALCGTCGKHVTGVKEPRGRLYQCLTRRHVVRRAEPVDELVRAVIVARLAQPDAREAFSRADDRDRTGELQAEEHRLRARLDGLAEAFAAGEVDRAQLHAGSARLRADLERVAAELDATVRTPDLGDLLSADDVDAAWDALSFDRQRAVLAALVTVTLHSPGRGARSFDPSTVEFTWRTDA